MFREKVATRQRVNGDVIIIKKEKEKKREPFAYTHILVCVYNMQTRIESYTQAAKQREY